MELAALPPHGQIPSLYGSLNLKFYFVSALKLTRKTFRYTLLTRLESVLSKQEAVERRKGGTYTLTAAFILMSSCLYSVGSALPGRSASFVDISKAYSNFLSKREADELSKMPRINTNGSIAPETTNKSLVLVFRHL